MKNDNLKIVSLREMSRRDKDYKNSPKARGFTLVETIAAVSILTIAVMGPMYMASRNIGAVIVAQNRITASGLAQEAIEYVRNIRDTNFIKKENDWLKDLNQCFGASGCYIDVVDNVENDFNNVQSCGGTCPLIKYDGTYGQYGYVSGNNTIFTRQIKITKNPNGNNIDEANIKVTVSWRERFGLQNFVLEENLFDWQK